MWMKSLLHNCLIRIIQHVSSWWPINDTLCSCHGAVSFYSWYTVTVKPTSRCRFSPPDLAALHRDDFGQQHHQNLQGRTIYNNRHVHVMARTSNKNIRLTSSVLRRLERDVRLVLTWFLHLYLHVKHFDCRFVRIQQMFLSAILRTEKWI